MDNLKKGTESTGGNKYMSGGLGPVNGGPISLLNTMNLGGLGKKGKGKQATEASKQILPSSKLVVGQHGGNNLRSWKRKAHENEDTTRLGMSQSEEKNQLALEAAEEKLGMATKKGCTL